MPGLPKKYIKKYGVSKKAWAEYRKAKARTSRKRKASSGKKKTKTTRKRRTKVKTKKQVKKTMAKRKRKTTKRKTRSRKRVGSVEQTLGTLGKVSAGVVLGLGLMDTVNASGTGSPMTIQTLIDNTSSRIQGVFGKLGNKDVLTAVGVGTIIAAKKVKVPGISKALSSKLGMGMALGAITVAAATPGSPGKPVFGGSPLRTRQAAPRVDVINQRR